MKHKAYLSILFAAIVLLALSSCGKAQPPAATTEPTAAAQQTEPQTVPETVAEVTIPANWEKATEDEPWKVTLAEDLFQQYGVLPEYYEDLGDGIYQVYVEVGGEILPFVTVNAATGDYHG